MNKFKLIFLALTVAVAGCKEKKTSAEVINQTPIEEDYGGWNVGSFTDEYGDEIDEHYVYNNFSGVIFEPDTKDGHKMVVHCVIYSKYLSFQFYAYGYRVNEGSFSELNIKDENGKEHKFRKFNLMDRERDSIVALMSSPQLLKFSFYTGPDYGRRGVFSVQGCKGLKKMISNQKW